MKNVIFRVALLFAALWTFNVQAQVTNAYVVSDIATMKTYAGYANRIHVVAENKDYVLCPTCGAPDEATVYAGASGRKWKIFDPEVDPVFSASPSVGITNTNITNWNTAYGWGNHSVQGYLTSTTGVPSSRQLTIAGTTLDLTANRTWSPTTTNIPEGTNLYFTEARVRSTPLTGYTVGTNTALTATDNFLQAMGKLQSQINNIGAGGSGTVTNFSAGDLSPLFTTTETNTSTTPALSFSLTNAPANSIFGRFNSATGAPAYGSSSANGQYLTQRAGTLGFNTIQAADLPDLSGTYLTPAAAASAYQPLDGDLTSIAGIAGTSGLLRKTAANTWSLDASSYLTSYTETDPTVLSKVLTGYSVGTNTALAATDNILGAFGKVQAQLNNKQAAGSYLTANQNITISGDISGSGTTAITATLPTVNSNVGTFNNVTVNGKGLVTAASNVAYPTGSGSAGRLAYWSGASALTSNSGLLFDGTTFTAPSALVTDLAGSGTRMVVANAGGTLSTQAIPSGGTTYTFNNSSIQNTANNLTLVGDASAPGNNYVYGTSSAGSKGWQPSALIDLTGLTTNDFIKWDGSKFVRTPPPSGAAGILDQYAAVQAASSWHDTARVSRLRVDSNFHMDLGGYEPSYIYVPVGAKTSQFATGNPRKGQIVISNRPREETENYTTAGWWKYWQQRGGNELLRLERTFNEADNDTALVQYNSIAISKNLLQLDHNSTRYDSANGKYVTLQDGGWAAGNQFNPTKNVVVRPSPFGTAGASFYGTFGVGKDSAFTITHVTNPSVPIPQAVYQSMISYNSQVPNTKTRIIRGGLGMTNYLAYWKSGQGEAGIVGVGSSMSRVTDFFSKGSLYVTPVGTLTTKADILSYSRLDTVMGFFSYPKYSATNEVVNGYGYGQEGRDDINFFQGATYFGSNHWPQKSTLDSNTNIRLGVYGSSWVRDSLTLGAYSSTTARLSVQGKARFGTNNTTTSAKVYIAGYDTLAATNTNIERGLHIDRRATLLNNHTGNPLSGILVQSYMLPDANITLPSGIANTSVGISVGAGFLNKPGVSAVTVTGGTTFNTGAAMNSSKFAVPAGSTTYDINAMIVNQRFFIEHSQAGSDIASYADLVIGGNNGMAGTVGDKYGLVVQDMAHANVNNEVAIYQEGLTDKNYFNGELYVNNTPASGSTADSVMVKDATTGQLKTRAQSDISGGGGGGGMADPGSNGILARTALNTTAARTITGTAGKITITNGDGASGNPVINVGADIVDKTTANTYTAGAKQTFAQSATDAGVNLGTSSLTPSSPAAGDLWYHNSDGALRYSTGAQTRTVVTENSTQTLTNKTFTGITPIAWATITGGVVQFTKTGSTSTAPAGSINFYARSDDRMVTINSAGTVKDLAYSEDNMPGTLLGVRYLTSGTSYVPTTGTTKIVAHLVGGGGGGGGVTGTNSNVGAAGGGAGGGYTMAYISGITATTYTYAIGAAGTAGTNTGTSGGSGGNTSITIGATTYTANGGGGGAGQTAGTAAAIANAGTPGAVGTNGDINRAGDPGNPGIRMSGTVGVSGAGGSSQFGGAGASLTTAGAGNAGTGYGAGGGGGLSTANTARAGGAGTAGIIIIYEYK